MKPYLKKQLMIAACLNIGHIIIGYSVAWTAPVVPKLQNIEETPLSVTLTVAQASWLGTALSVGFIIGPYISGALSLGLGRRICLFIGGLILLTSYITLTLAKSYATLIAGRVITGIGLGFIAVINMVYIGEIAPPDIRGVIMSSTGVFHSLGTLLIYSVGPFVSYADIGYVIISICCMHLLGCLYIPESPMFYVIKGKENEARKVLQHLGRTEDIENELVQIIRSVKEKDEGTNDWRNTFTNRYNRRALMITSVLLMMQQWSGMIAITYFVTTIFEVATSSVEPAIATIIVGVTHLCSTCTVPFLIDRAGRKTLLLFSTAGCCVSMVLLGVYFYLDSITHTAVSSLFWLPLASLMILFLSYCIGLNIIPTTLMGELFRPNVRSFGSSLAMTIGWFSGLMSIIAFGYILDGIGYVIFFIYACVNFFGFFFTMFYVPETKKLSLMEIENLFYKR